MFCLLIPSNPINIVLNNPSLSAVGGIIEKLIFNNSGVAATIVLNDTIQAGLITASITTTLQFGTAVIGGTGDSKVGGAISTVLSGTGTVIGCVVGGVCSSISILWIIWYISK